MKISNFDLTGKQTFIIAELSANHNGSLETALETVRAAKRCGANAIKLQTYTADTLTIDSQREDFIIKSGSIWDGKSYYKLYESAFTPWEWHKEIMDCASEQGLICFSSPFDFTAVDYLEDLNVPAYKIASFEITDIPLIKYTASKQKPIILSTGIASQEDIELALETVRSTGNNDIALLKCTSSYPAPIEEANLCMIEDFAKRYNVISGLSDHTLGIIAPVVAVCQGAKIIEKHFILDRSIGGPDASFSLDEKEFKEMVDAVRNAEKAIGMVDYSPTEKMIKGREFSRSLYVVKDINKGETFTAENVRSIRPGHGLHPQHLQVILGKRANKQIERGTRMSFDLIDE